MDIWQTATDSNKFSQTGWLGRYLDNYGEQPYNVIEVDDALSLALKGEKMNGIATQDAKVLFNLSRDPYFQNLRKHQNDAHLSEHNLGYLYKTMIEAQSSAKYIYETSKTVTSKKEYPDNKFGNQLKTTAQFINSGLQTKVFYTSLGSFDTHANQLNAQKKLLKIDLSIPLNLESSLLYQSINLDLSIKTTPRTHLGRSYPTTHLCHGHITESLVSRKPMWLEQ